MKRRVTNYLKPKSPFTPDSVYKPGHPPKSTEFGGAWLHSTNYKAAWKHEHVCTFIIVTKLTEAQGELGQIQACGYKDCNEHIFHVQVNIFSYQISNCSQFRLCFQNQGIMMKNQQSKQVYI